MHRHLIKTSFSPSTFFLPIKITHFPFSILPCKVPNRTFTCKSPNHENPNFDFKTYMLQKIKLVNHALESTVPLTTNPYKIHESMRYSLLSSGKRICPIVCLAACNLVGGDESAAMPTACALEMIHAMSLMHDDLPCMDDDSLRRGKPSNHVVFGENVTVVAGRSLIALAFEHITTTTKGVCSAGRILRVIEELGILAGPQGICAGQVVDLENKSDIGLEQLKWIHLHKTAALVEASIVAGAVLGGAGEEEIERLRKYARCAGLMYQVVDDILDVTKSSKELGKTAAKDLVCDKVTFPKLIGIEKSRDYVIELNVEAQEQLIGFDQERAAPLIALADFIVQRGK